MLSWRLIKIALLLERIWQKTWFESRGTRAKVIEWKPQNLTLKKLKGVAALSHKITTAYFDSMRSIQIKQRVSRVFRCKKLISPKIIFSRIYDVALYPVLWSTKGWLFMINFVLEI